MEQKLISAMNSGEATPESALRFYVEIHLADKSSYVIFDQQVTYRLTRGGQAQEGLTKVVAAGYPFTSTQ